MIVGAVAVSGASYFAGVEVKTKEVQPQLEKLEKVKTEVKKIETVDSLSSQLVSSILVAGEVKNISDKSVVLISASGAENLEISLEENANIILFQENKAISGTLSDIKVGDYLNVNLKVLSNGDIQGTTVKVIPKSENEGAR